MDTYVAYLKNKRFIFSVAVSLLVLGVSLIINFYAGMYAVRKASNPVTDIILDNIPTYDVDGIFIYGPAVLAAFIVGCCVVRPRWIPFTAKSTGLFILIRSMFISMTHLGVIPTAIHIASSNILDKVTFGADLFFSGHTGLPFLMALVFWNQRIIRYIFLGFSFLFAAIVLMGHIHYSIDVFSAFFISATIFNLSERFFRSDRHLFNTGVLQQ